MNITDIIDKNIGIARQCAPDQVADLEVLKAKVLNTQMKVTVLGDFKAGKSTILNRLFLKEPLLPVDYGECTAVPTQIANGPRRLQLWKRDHATGAESLVQEMDSFDDSTLAAMITAVDESARAEKAEKYSRAVLTLPDILPDNICLVDTPGLNSTNRGIIVGTMAEAQDADLLLYVVRGKTLARREIDLLASMCGMQLKKLPVFVVVTHDGTQAPAQLENICGEIRASLAAIGITASCAPFDIRSSSSSVSVDVASAPVEPGASAGFDSWFDDEPAPEAQPATPAPEQGGDLGTTLSSFFSAHVVQGRTAKILRELRPVTEQIRMKAQTKLKLSHANAEQVAALQNQLRKMRFEYNRKAEIMMEDIRAKQILFQRKLAAEVDNLIRAKKTALQPLKGIQDVVSELKAWNEHMPTELGNIVEMLKMDLARGIRETIHQFGHDLEVGFNTAARESVEFDAGFLSKLPSWAVLIGDYALTQFLSPLPFIIDIPLRYIFSDLPILPANLLAGVAKRIAEQNLDEAASKLKASLTTSLSAEMSRMSDDLRSRLSASATFADAEQELENAEKNQISAEDEQKLKGLLQELDTINDTL